MSSVHKGEREESPAEFTVCARQLKIMTVDKCAKLPRRYTHGIIDPLLKCANHIKHLVVEANSVHPTTANEAKDRREMLMIARAELFAMASDIDDMMEMKDKFNLSYEDARQWTGKVYAEIRLINGIMDSDSRRYRDLP